MRVRWTEPAVRDLTSICDYIEQHDGGQAARTIALRIFEAAESLVRFPRRGRTGSDPATRELVLAPWLVIYSVNDDAVEIVRILHGAQNRP
jgi:toxin ParE1/3/4